ncbi:hypothetical protein SE17_08055 [Kouleothrix aurantiaca]|jgi:hypothetical protein|uniref:Uncharacterized protein n=1 Tax=Kouleothrix aurantiaca TaxID=186479 RepID=A0A0P9FAL6_9CHLR|nr:hypothetical protein SE17_08055 [Kouleothrix aurantiaca]
MSQGLTPEDRERIAEEERIRLKTQAKEGFKMLGKMYLVAGAVFLFVMICACLFFLGVFSK